MIRLQLKTIASVDDAVSMLQTAIGIEFGTLPPYLYALYSIPPGANAAAASRIKSIVLQEMIHMCLACNILNALGGNPELSPPTYPGTLPGDIGKPGHDPLEVRLLPFSKAAMQQGMNIEEPEAPIEFPMVTAEAAAPEAVTIGQFYHALDDYLATLPESAWSKGRHQIDDAQFFAGQLFAVNGYQDAHDAIGDIISEGEGAADSPLDFQHDLAHYYRFSECFRNQVLTKADNPKGYAWGASLGIDWNAVYPAISDPGTHDFSNDPPAAQAAQAVCNEVFSRMVGELQLAVTGSTGRLGNAVRAMFDLRTAARVAFTTPLADPSQVSGPGFLYISS